MVRQILTEYTKLSPDFPTFQQASAEFARFGLGVPLGPFSRVFAAFKNRGVLIGRQVSQPLTQVIQGIQMPAGTANQPFRFRFTFTGTTLDVETGRIRDQFFFIDLTDTLSPANALAELLDRFDPDRYPSLRIPDELVFRGAFRRPDPF